MMSRRITQATREPEGILVQKGGDALRRQRVGESVAGDGECVLMGKKHHCG
jgi:hypothetical protein